MDLEEYARKLKEYIHLKTYVLVENNSIISGDQETPLILKILEDGAEIYPSERGKLGMPIAYSDAEAGAKKFAQNIKASYDYPLPESKSPANGISYFRRLGVLNFDQAKKYYENLLNFRYYSLNMPQRGKLNFQVNEDGSFSIYYYGFNGQKKFYHKLNFANGEIIKISYGSDPEAFARFYSLVNMLEEYTFLETEYQSFWGKDLRPWEEVQDELMF